jgi:hypothetical protein
MTKNREEAKCKHFNTAASMRWQATNDNTFSEDGVRPTNHSFKSPQDMGLSQGKGNVERRNPRL